MSRILTAAGALVDRIKINAISREVRGGHFVWIKRRRPIARPLLACANHFFELAGTPVRALTKAAVWQQWEVECFRQLHEEDGFHAFRDGNHAVGAEEMPGVNLTRHLDDGSITEEMAAAAARELRRTHETHSTFFRGAWSHGDPHLGNFIYEKGEDRARLIDFEVRHHQSLPAEERHCDDLLVFLQDMVGRICERQWLPCATAFLETYDCPALVAQLGPKLDLPPQSVPRLWWLVRTTFLPVAELRRRIMALRRELAPMLGPALHPDNSLPRPTRELVHLP